MFSKHIITWSCKTKQHLLYSILIHYPFTHPLIPMCCVDGYTDKTYIEGFWAMWKKNITKQDSDIQRLVLPQCTKTLERKKKKKKTTQNKQHISAFIPRQQTKQSSGAEAAACRRAVSSDDTSLRCYRLSTSLPPNIFLRPACTAHCLSDRVGQLRRWHSSGNK